MKIFYFEYANNEKKLLEEVSDISSHPLRGDRIIFMGYVFDVLSVTHFLHNPFEKRILLSRLCKEDEA